MSAIGGTSASNPARTTDASETGFNSLSSEEFIRVIFAELTRQDPTQPTNSKDLLEQLSSIRGIESDIELSEKLEDIAKQSEITSAGSLVGKFVSGLTDSAARTRGFVDSVLVTREGVVLNLSSGAKVPLSQVVEIVDPDLVSSEGTGQAQGSRTAGAEGAR